jgi:hypothetical protein
MDDGVFFEYFGRIGSKISEGKKELFCHVRMDIAYLGNEFYNAKKILNKEKIEELILAEISIYEKNIGPLSKKEAVSIKERDDSIKISIDLFLKMDPKKKTISKF